MIHPAFPVTLLALVAPAASTAGQDLDGIRLAQVTIHERIIIRLPRLAAPAPAPASASAASKRLAVGRTPMSPMPVKWKEKKGPKCVAVDEIGGVIVGDPDSLDMVLTGNRRIRAQLEGDCKPLDFYSGFYLRPAPDGKVCADRDAIRMRSGASCGIDAFKTLVVAR